MEGLLALITDVSSLIQLYDQRLQHVMFLFRDLCWIMSARKVGRRGPYWSINAHNSDLHLTS